MIAEVVLVVAGGVLLGRWLTRTMRGARDGAGGERRSPEEQARGDGLLLRGFACQLGDVILRTAEHDEAWLAGALVFEEDRPVAALFVAPEAGVDRAIFVRSGAGVGLAWLTPLPSGMTVGATEPPHALELGDAKFERLRRLPVHVRRMGSGAPVVGAKAILAEYAGGANERVVAVAGGERVLLFRGVQLAEGEYEVLPGERP